MRKNSTIRVLKLATTAPAALLLWAVPAHAQSVEAAQDTIASDDTEAQGEAGAGDIVVTGSRIRRSQTDTPAPVLVVDQQNLTDRGYVSASQALNNITSIVPALAQAPGNGNSAGSGQQFPNLFGLGAGRTLTLVNGRRMVTSSSGLGDAQVDANIIPIGLLKRVEVVQAGGAVVYGSDAIAGVVNYILVDDFEGVEADLQASTATRGRYDTYSARLTAGTNFADDRGNIAINLEYTQRPSLSFADRARSNLSRITQTNPLNTGPNDGIPSVREVLDAHFWEFNTNGIIFNTPAPVPALLTRVNGSPVQFGPDGSVIPYDPGTILGVPFATGGQGFRYSDLAGLRTGVKRTSINAIGHYDLTDKITLSTELMFARTDGSEMPQATARTILNNAASNAGPIAFTRTNPFLTSQAVTALTAASPTFAAGGPLFLSKSFYDLVPDNRIENRTDTYRGVLSLDGSFNAFGNREFYWSLSGSHARVDGYNHGWGVINSRYNNAINAALNGSGQIVCAINADALTTNDDPNCAPINPFGEGNVSEAARNYISARTGQDFLNKQTDLLATLGGDIFELPGGMVKFSAAYEHRAESVKFRPLDATRLGLTGLGTSVPNQSGKYNTDEFSGELLIPLVGGDFTLPLVKSLEVTAAYRYVDNSIAGSENLWSVGGQWGIVDGVTLRASRSRNFRAPTLRQLFAPSSSALSTIAVDPCDADRISGGPDPVQRRANCLALFQANPAYGTGGTGSAAPGSSAEVRLASFQDPAENFNRALVTSGGNPNLRNEISKTFTYGIILQPRFIPGLTIVADRIEVDLKDGLSAFTTQNFAETCYDDANPDPTVCGAFSRLATGNGTDPAGTIVTGTTTTFNAGVVRYRGEVYNINYQFDLAPIFGGENAGRLELNAEATHTSLLTTSVTGGTFTRSDNTAGQPDWSGRFTATYINGGFRASYQLAYLDKVLSGPDATIENTPTPIYKANYRHDLSVQYDMGNFLIRAGVNNLTNEEPSYPSISYGDIIGRELYVGARVKF